jgi:hypothetical protein
MNELVTKSDSGFKLKGEFWIRLGNNLSREDVIENADRHIKNLIVDIASNQIAEWAFTGTITNVSEHVKGIMTLAVGTGAIGWDLQNPPAESPSQEFLVNELTRKLFISKTYIDPVLLTPTLTRTNIIDFTTTFLETEAVGPLVEMGLFAGNHTQSGATDSTAPNGGTMINAKNFPVINKPNTSQLSVVWRLTF